jgi:CubicO group peptidase (beta-lactamase class C family)
MNRIAYCLLAPLLSFSYSTEAREPDTFLRLEPEAAGYSSERLNELRALLKTSGSDSLLLVHDGKVFFEYGDIRKKLLLHSMRKPLLNALYGIYEARGLVAMESTLADLGVDDIAPSLTSTEKTATLADVLKSRSGVYHPAAAESEGMAQSRPARGSYAPGTHYYYNNWDFNVAGHILERAGERRIYDVFYDEIAKPLGMLDYRNRIVIPDNDGRTSDHDADGYYHYEMQHSRFPAYHFRMSAHDLALFGQLYLQRGRWHGRQIVPAAWIARSTQPYSIVEPEYGLAYGVLWNVLVPDPQDETPSFYHTGVGVHMLGVYPRHKLVMVHRVDTERTHRFNDGDLYPVIRMIHAARLPATPAR